MEQEIKYMVEPTQLHRCEYIYKNQHLKNVCCGRSVRSIDSSGKVAKSVIGDKYYCYRHVQQLNIPKKPKKEKKERKTTDKEITDFLQLFNVQEFNYQTNQYETKFVNKSVTDLCEEFKKVYTKGEIKRIIKGTSPNKHLIITKV